MGILLRASHLDPAQRVYCTTVVTPLDADSLPAGESMEKMLQRLDTLVRRALQRA